MSPWRRRKPPENDPGPDPRTLNVEDVIVVTNTHATLSLSRECKVVRKADCQAHGLAWTDVHLVTDDGAKWLITVEEKEGNLFKRLWRPLDNVEFIAGGLIDYKGFTYSVSIDVAVTYDGGRFRYRLYETVGWGPTTQISAREAGETKRFSVGEVATVTMEDGRMHVSYAAR